MFYQTNCMHAGRRKSRQMTFLSLVILTFDLCLTLTFRLIWTRDQTRFPCESDANPSSGSRDISQTGGAKNRTFRSSPRAVTSNIRACVGFWCFAKRGRVLRWTGLIHPRDELRQVNGVAVTGRPPDDVIQLIVRTKMSVNTSAHGLYRGADLCLSE